MEKNYQALEANKANHVPLTPISFLNRAALVYADRTAVDYGNVSRTWKQTAERCRAIASALSRKGIVRGDTISVIAPNVPELFELHFAVPLSGAVLNTINMRLEAETIAYIFDHADTKLIIADTQFAPLVREAFKILGREIEVIDIKDNQADTPDPIGSMDYDSLLATGDANAEPGLPEDEWQAIALNYTSGTSGRPKGVVYHHRGAYLMALGTISGWSLPDKPVYMSVVPMFHCNGWNHPWSMAIVGGHMVFTRDLAPELLLKTIAQKKITHFGAAPIILQMLAESEHAPANPYDPPVTVMTAGAPPPPAILEKTAKMGLNVMQVYGLTETYGHITQCLWREEWAALPAAQQAEMQAMQGIAFPIVEDVQIMDREAGRPVAKDGQTQGEIAIRGNTVMKGYYKDPKASAEAFTDGWFWSGDAAVVHENGYMQIRDRLKDVIISGGENISSVEVEAVLYRHPAVQAAAIVAKPHEKWGEVPCAFVELREGMNAEANEIISFCREHLAGFKTPKAVVFGELPKTSTGKIQKFVLREQARQDAS